MELPPPAQYFPIRNGRYDVAPALRPFGASFGNGAADERVFQLDAEFAVYRANKLACRAGRPGRHVATVGLEPRVAAAVTRLLTDRLRTEHPDWFNWRPGAGGGGCLDCALTGDTLVFDAEMQWATGEAEVAYTDALDALACQVQEDLAVVCQASDGADQLAAYHICAPSHWSPEEKRDRGFAAIHAPVPGMAAVINVAGSMVEAMIHRGPFVRFAWGLDTDRRLNRHPEPPEGVNAVDWQSPPFDPGAPAPVIFRVERQVTWGMPEVSAALFVIRPYLTEGALVRNDPAKREALRSAVAGMSPESRAYKGVQGYADALLRWLG